MSAPAAPFAPPARKPKRPRVADAYDAFISYSHAADGQLAPRLEEGLERLAKPLLRPRALNVFRDGTGLSATPELWPTIQRELDKAHYFILMASPGAAASPWVAAEVEHWLTASPAARQGEAARRLLMVLTEGEIAWDAATGGFDPQGTTALPPRLHHGVFRHEPLWVDLREARTQEDLSLHNAYFRGKVADLAAPIHGTTKDELIGEDVRIARRNRRLAWTVSLLLAALAITATGFALVARQQRNRAQSRALAAAAVAQLDIDPRESLAGAVSAVEKAPTSEAIATLRESLIRSALIAELRADSGTIVSAEFAPRGDRVLARVALGDGRGFVQTWTADGARGCIIPAASYRRFSTDWAGVVTSDGRVLDVHSCAPLQRDTAEGEVLTPAWVVAGDPRGPEQTIRDARTGAVVLTIPTDVVDGVAGVVPSQDGRQAVTWAAKGLYRESGGGPSEWGEKFARVWTLRNHENTRPDVSPTGHLLFGHRRAINAAAFGGNVIATGSDDRTVRVWTRRFGTDDWEEAAVLPGHRAAVVGVALSGYDERVVSVAADGTARLWQTGNGMAPFRNPGEVFRDVYGRRLPALRGPQPEGVPVLTRDGRRVVAAAGGLRVASWNAATGARLGRVLDLARYFTESGPPPGVEDLAERLSPDGARILVPLGKRNYVTDGDSATLVVETATGAVLDTIYGHQGPVYAAAWSPDGGWIATGGEDGRVRVWNARTLAPGRGLRVPGTRVLHVAFSPGGERVVVSTRDALARVWTPATRSVVELFGHEGAVERASFSPDGVLVVSVGDDGVRVWDAASGKMLRRYMSAGPAWALLSPDCARLVVGMYGGELSTHTLPFGACGPVDRMMERARARVRTEAAGLPRGGAR